MLKDLDWTHSIKSRALCKEETRKNVKIVNYAENRLTPLWHFVQNRARKKERLARGQNARFPYFSKTV